MPGLFSAVAGRLDARTALMMVIIIMLLAVLAAIWSRRRLRRGARLQGGRFCPVGVSRQPVLDLVVNAVRAVRGPVNHGFPWCSPCCPAFNCFLYLRRERPVLRSAAVVGSGSGSRTLPFSPRSGLVGGWPHPLRETGFDQSACRASLPARFSSEHSARSARTGQPQVSVVFPVLPRFPLFCYPRRSWELAPIFFEDGFRSLEEDGIPTFPTVSPLKSRQSFRSPGLDSLRQTGLMRHRRFRACSRKNLAS